MPVHNRIGAIPAPGGGFVDPRTSLIHQGPIVPVQIEVPQALATQLQTDNKPVPTPLFGFALIDTGASISGIDTTVIQHLGVQPVGQQVLIGGATGQKMRSTYPARFTFPGSSLPAMHFGQLAETELSGITLPGTQGSFLALIGRDILCHFVLVYNGPNGTFTLAC